MTKFDCFFKSQCTTEAMFLVSMVDIYVRSCVHVFVNEVTVKLHLTSIRMIDYSKFKISVCHAERKKQMDIC